MKKLESTWYNMAVVLTAIAFIAGAALASVNEMTKGPIQELKTKTEQEAISQVLGGGEVQVQKTDTVDVDGSKYVVCNAGEKGVAVRAVDPSNASFGGGLTIMVGFNPDGVILGYKVLESNETPGLGAKAGEWFQKGAKGDIIGKNLTEGDLSVSKDGGNVDAITASTITSRAFLRAVNAGYAAFRQTLGRGPVATDSMSGATGKTNNIR